MTPLSWIAIALWAIVGLIAAFSRASVQFNGHYVENRFLRFLVGAFIPPIVGIIFLILGMIGWLLAAPIVELMRTWFNF